MMAQKYFALGVRLVLSTLLLAVCSTGCTYHQLRKNTANQALTISELHQQQVLDNVALFVNNKDALPFFALPTQGTSEINDKGAITPLLTWSRITTAPLVGDFLFNTAQTTMTAERAAKQNWTLNPINDPRKLELMRCAYQRAIGSCCGGMESGSCPNCSERFNLYYTGRKDKVPATTNVTAECLSNTCCWFRVGSKHDIPTDCCNFVGKYCDTYVWVPKGGRDTLSKLTLVILDFALNDGRKTSTKEVVYYLDADGRPTASELSVTKVTATIAISDTNNSILLAPYADAIGKILEKYGISIRDLNEISASEIVLKVKSEEDFNTIVELLRRSGFSTDSNGLSIVDKMIAGRDKAKKLNIDINSVEAVSDFNEETNLDTQRIQITPASSYDSAPATLGPPPLLQLNQLLETVR